MLSVPLHSSEEPWQYLQLNRKRERAQNKPGLNLGTTVQMLLSNPTFLNGRDLSFLSARFVLLPLLLLCLTLSLPTLSEKLAVLLRMLISFRNITLPLWSVWESAQGRAWLLLLQLSNVHYNIFITLGVLECITLQLRSPCGIYAFYPLPLNWLGL